MGRDMAFSGFLLTAALAGAAVALPSTGDTDGSGTVFLEFANGAKKPVFMAPSTRFKGQTIGHVHLAANGTSIGEDVQWSSKMKIRFLKGAVSKKEGGSRQLTLMGKLNKGKLGEGAGANCGSLTCSNGQVCSKTYARTETGCGGTVTGQQCSSPSTWTKLASVSSNIELCRDDDDEEWDVGNVHGWYKIDGNNVVVGVLVDDDPMDRCGCVHDPDDCSASDISQGNDCCDVLASITLGSYGSCFKTCASQSTSLYCLLQAKASSGGGFDGQILTTLKNGLNCGSVSCRI